MRQVVFALAFLLVLSLGIFAQVKSQEVSADDGIPVIIKNLPQWENVREKAVLIKNQNELRKALGERPIFEVIDFEGGTEAVAAQYPTGKMLLVEYNTPQFSIDVDNKVKLRLAELQPNPPVYYRRIGNYNVFVFDAVDEASANELLGQVKYEKVVQWLGEDPFLQDRVQNYKTRSMGEVLLSTLLAIVFGFGGSVLFGIGVGALVFYFRKRQRDTWEKFSDAGGMLRLNLDDLQEAPANRLLKD